MSNLPKPLPAKHKLDPSIIERAPLGIGSQGVDLVAGEDNKYLVIIGELASRLETSEAEAVRLKSKKSVEDARVELMGPFTKGVFRFAIGYCICVGAIIVASGANVGGFRLSDTILGILAGSTAVSVIGLVGSVIGGLFGVSRGSKS